MNKIQQSNTFHNATVKSPVGIVLDTDVNMLVTVYGNSFIQNGTNSLITFLNWYSSLFNFTYNRTISVPFNKSYGLAKSNDDTMIYVSGNLSIIYYNIYLVCSCFQ
jgi:hypothetical protein